MTNNDGAREPADPVPPPTVNTKIASPARVYDYWLGGKDNYRVDREAAELVMAANPGIISDVRANRAFLGRAVRHLAGPVGIRQFLDIGTGLPTESNTHEVAQFVAPDARIVYVDNDPIVLLHSQSLLTSTAEGRTDYLRADLRDPDAILGPATRTLDFDRPIAVMLLQVLQFIDDAEDPGGLITRLLRAVPPGSHLVISHPAKDIRAEVTGAATARYNSRVGTKMTRRTHDEVRRLFRGLDLLEPGLVQLPRWRPHPDTQELADQVASWCGVARKG